MASSQAKGTRWGSLLSQAVAGVEARLDNILSETDEAAKAAGTALAVPPQPPRPQSRSSSRANDRLQERLARAVAAKGGAQSPTVSSFSQATASAAASPRQSFDVASRTSIDSTATAPRDTKDAKDSLSVAGDAPGSRRPSFEPAAETRGAEETKDAQNTKELPSQSVATGELATSYATTEAAATLNSAAATQTPATPTAVAIKVEPPAEPAKATLNTAVPASSTYTPTPAPQPPASNAALDAVHEARIKKLEEELEEERRQHQEEMLHTAEKMEAMQSKVQYLSREVAEAAKKSIESAEPGSLERKLAEKDQQIAQLMEEGKNLGVTEQKHRAILKKLRLKISEGEKQISDLRTTQTKTESELQTLRVRVRRVAELERAQEDAHRRTSQAQKELEAMRSDAVSKDATIANLKQQLRAAHESAEALKAKVNDEALQKERQRAKELEDQVAATRLEKTLAADRARVQINEWKEKAEKAAERTRAVEAEAKNEVLCLESKLEAMRSRSEEVSSGAIGDSQAKLMRQVETLQSQYSIASNNWQGIESTLLARVSNLEKERDEALQRESDMRKKAREAALRAKRNEEDLEEVRSKLPKAQEDVSAFEARIESLEKRAQEAEAARDQLKTELESQKAAASWKEERQHGAGDREPRRMDSHDRGSNWLESLPNLPGLPLSPVPPQMRAGGSNSRPETPLLPQNPSRTWSSELLGFQGLAMSNKLRKASAPSSQDDSAERLSMRRPSGQPPARPSILLTNSNSGSSILSGTPQVLSPTAMTDTGAGSLPSSLHHNGSDNHSHNNVLAHHQNRHASVSANNNGSASASTVAADTDDPHDLDRDHNDQGATLMQDMVSVSTVAAGPSVQLVERMSAAIRRLESEKVAAREELSRISKQRNEARAEVLVLIQDAEAHRAASERVAELETQVADLQARYDTTLELLGEKSELVEELRADVQDVKDMYRDLIERTVT